LNAHPSGDSISTASASSETEAASFGFDNVTRRYGNIAAVDSVTLDFAAGSVTALVGSSGSGKSTLLRLLLGLEWPDQGEIILNNAVVGPHNAVAIRRACGYVIQSGGLFPHLSAAANLALLPRYLGWTQAAIDARIRELAELVNLDAPMLARYPGELSGGQRQRVALMRALIIDPPVLLLDEPLGALDPIIRHQLQDELLKIFSAIAKTVIVVTHDLAEAAFLAPRLVLMRSGRVIQDGTLQDFRKRPADDFVSRFVAAQRVLPAA
jgi:osmoprotectant transport system ATP-binding protein